MKKQNQQTDQNDQNDQKDDNMECRICLFGPKSSLINGNSTANLITPCNCQGKFAYVHQSCISRWVEITGHEFCDICRLKFIMTKKRKSFSNWLHEEFQDGKELGLALTVLLYSSFQLLFTVYICIKLQTLCKCICVNNVLM